ncbi:MAG: DUF305 domain-containing protein, partial [Gemmatimonadota bacterium]
MPVAVPVPAPAPPADVAAAGAASATSTATVAAPATAAAPAAGGHEHHGMAPITIPKGALYTVADVEFMQGMIAHHAQAIYMSKLAVTRGANPRLLRLAKKIDQSQDAEIRQMQE